MPGYFEETVRVFGTGFTESSILERLLNACDDDVTLRTRKCGYRQWYVWLDGDYAGKITLD